MAYYILNKNNIQDYVYTFKSMQRYFSNEPLDIEEIGDGNINFVFKLQSKTNPSKALILKQAVPYLRCLGEDFNLNRKRMDFEIKTLESFEKLCLNISPKLYETSFEMSMIIMQYLDKHIILRKGLIAQNIYPHFSSQIGTFLAHNLFKSSSLHLNSREKRELIGFYNNNAELCSLSEQYVFSYALMEHESNNPSAKTNIHAKNLFLDKSFKKEVLKLKYKFMTQSDALIHGDLHTGSIMINQEESFVIDPEFSFIGPFAFDIGALIANLLISYASHKAQNHDLEYQEYLLKTIKEILEIFSKEFKELWKQEKESALLVENFLDEETLNSYKDEFILKILQDSLGFAACKMARRMFGAAGVEDIQGIQDETIRNQAIEYTLNIAKNFLLEYENIKDIKEILPLIKKA